jgi:hypothetical protein
MQLAESSLGEVLLSSRDIMALGEVLDHLLAKPATRKDPSLGVAEPPL